jgi:hypothetical protein
VRALEFRCIGTAYHPCHACGDGDVSCWAEEPYPGHNSATLYECSSCDGVFTLADIIGHSFGDLPSAEAA